MGTELTNFLYKWQDLVGSAVGFFSAGILSVLGFWFKASIGKRSDRKEHLSQIETSMTRSLNDACTAREQLKYIADVIKNLALSSSQNSHPHEFFLEQICFPIIQEIHRDTEIPSFKVKSYYLHNKLLMMDAWIKQTNRVTENLKHDFEALIHQNEVLIAMMSKNSQSAIEQKQMYAINLKNFAKVIEDVGVKSFVLGIKMMVQIKVYNEKLRRKYGFLFLWKCEKQKFNYFRTKDWQKKSADEFFSSSKQIDAIIEQEVEYCIQDAESNRKAFGDY